MLLRNSPHKDPKKDSPLKSQGIIKDSPTERCCFTDVHIDRIRHCFPANAVFKSFTPTALSDSVSNTWVAFPATPFTIGYSYPFPSFTQSFFSLTGISYIQAMPMIWMVLYTFERIIEQEGLIWGWRSWPTISIAHLKLSPAAKERVLAFKKLDPEVRSFQVTIQDSQEISSASATMSSAGKSARSVKSASKFGISDLANVTSSKKKAPAASPSASAPKAPIRGKGKKRKASDDLQGFPLLRQQFLDYVNEKLAEIETYLGHVEDQESQIADLQQMGVLKDLKIGDLEKELRVMKAEAAQRLIDMDNEKQEITQDAKVSAAIAMYKIQLQMAEEAQDPTFDKSSWDVEGWKARLADLEDEDEAEEIPMLEGGGAEKDQGGAAGGDGAAKE
ncbi:hypothetical protein HanRHA438_Chr15g0701491 [Helianthus annuus]|nr:hypothetical protein HanHA300_Chr15g0561411 [Helianthus annuus]KAJ0472756.1 hypothetical protein HanHA89_Chr15g0610621 [Helianthus annuus]KAJ0648363.1 hypothetical protein HanLR1_Chr15g0572031 [Helianthus annuus]KAJ0652194.1 hypothetical protein HanOQP8_Chr15g0569391 [Helianthus annuus]KAJ0844354.1 hypothetical protein HanRHA438_Chr15g0701491 [Helianthus annuus]